MQEAALEEAEIRAAEEKRPLDMKAAASRSAAARAFLGERRAILERNYAFGCMHEVDVPRHGRVSVTPHVFRLIQRDRAEACPQRTEVWYRKRRDHVTASMMATVCNANPYESRSSALLKKTGRGKPFTGNAATEHGNKYELEAILKYEQQTNAKCLEFGLLESLNEGEEFLAGSPDGITTTGRLIEVKCPFRRTPTSKVPDYYVYQVQFLMHILQLRDCDFIQYVPQGSWAAETFIVTRLQYDPAFWFAKAPILRCFWDEVLRVRAMQARAEIADEEEDEEDGSEAEASVSLRELEHKKRPLVIDIDVDVPPPRPPKAQCLVEIPGPAAEAGAKAAAPPQPAFAPPEALMAAVRLRSEKCL
jgi:putative phage-type endonuclease